MFHGTHKYDGLVWCTDFGVFFTVVSGALFPVDYPVMEKYGKYLNMEFNGDRSTSHGMGWDGMVWYGMVKSTGLVECTQFS